jgi:hypothetical protein
MTHATINTHHIAQPDQLVGRMCLRAQQVATHAFGPCHARELSKLPSARAFLTTCCIYTLAMPYLGGKVSNHAQNETSTRSGHTKHHAQQTQNPTTLMITPRRRNGRPRSRNRRTRCRPSKNRARKWQAPSTFTNTALYSRPLLDSKYIEVMWKSGRGGNIELDYCQLPLTTQRAPVL